MRYYRRPTLRLSLRLNLTHQGAPDSSLGAKTYVRTSASKQQLSRFFRIFTVVKKRLRVHISSYKELKSSLGWYYIVSVRVWNEIRIFDLCFQRKSSSKKKAAQEYKESRGNPVDSPVAMVWWAYLFTIIS